MKTLVQHIRRLFLFVGLVWAAAMPAHAVDPDPAILTAVDATIAAVNAGSVTDVQAAFLDAPAAIADDFPPYSWSGKDAVPRYMHDLKSVLAQLSITQGRFQRNTVRFQAEAGGRAMVVVPVSFPFMMSGKPQSANGDWLFVLVKQGDRWKVDVMSLSLSHHTLLP